MAKWVWTEEMLEAIYEQKVSLMTSKLKKKKKKKKNLEILLGGVVNVISQILMERRKRT